MRTEKTNKEMTEGLVVTTGQEPDREKLGKTDALLETQTEDIKGGILPDFSVMLGGGGAEVISEMADNSSQDRR